MTVVRTSIAVTPVEGNIAKARMKVDTKVPYFTPAGVSLRALELADEVVSGAGRRTTAPVRKWFVRALEDGQTPMMSTLYSGAGRGGRSGYVSIKVLLTLLWKTSKPPFETVMTAPALAELLDLPDPAVKGARRVRDALRTLSEAGLIRMIPRPGTSPIIRLMNETGNREHYTLPSTSHVLAMQKKSDSEAITDPDLYFQLPSELWTEGFIQKLTGPGLVMLLILLAEQANKRPVWFAGSEFSDRYKISPSTRTKGTGDLVHLGMLNRQSVPLPAMWGGSSFEQKRRRYEYFLVGVISRLPKESSPASLADAWAKLSGTASPPTAPATAPASEAKKRSRRPKK